MARLKVNGGLDGTFGKQGKAYADFFGGNDTARDVVAPVQRQDRGGGRRHRATA